MADFSVSIRGNDELIAELEAATGGALPGARQVVSKGALNVKTDWRRLWSGIKHAPHIPRSIDYDLESDTDGASAQIGPQDDPVTQGFLGAILEYGGIHNAPVPGGQPAFDAEQPRFEAAADALLRKLLP